MRTNLCAHDSASPRRKKMAMEVYLDVIYPFLLRV
nr:MAG TPA: hypothetical protein [Caudoviricetes sp.]